METLLEGGTFSSVGAFKSSMLLGKHFLRGLALYQGWISVWLCIKCYSSFRKVLCLAFLDL